MSRFRQINLDLDNDYADLFFFLLILLIVIYLLWPGLKASFPQRFNCQRYNNDFLGCVQAQQAGRGCFWFADCNKCLREGDDFAKVCR